MLGIAVSINSPIERVLFKKVFRHTDFIREVRWLELRLQRVQFVIVFFNLLAGDKVYDLEHE